MKFLLSRVWLFATMEFSRPEYWSGQPFPSLGNLPNPGIEPTSPTLQADSLPAEPQGKPSDNEALFIGELSLSDQMVGQAAGHLRARSRGSNSLQLSSLLILGELSFASGNVLKMSYKRVRTERHQRKRVWWHSVGMCLPSTFVCWTLISKKTALWGWREWVGGDSIVRVKLSWMELVLL